MLIGDKTIVLFTRLFSIHSTSQIVAAHDVPNDPSSVVRKINNGAYLIGHILRKASL